MKGASLKGRSRAGMGRGSRLGHDCIKDIIAREHLVKLLLVNTAHYKSFNSVFFFFFILLSAPTFFFSDQSCKIDLAFVCDDCKATKSEASQSRCP